MFAAHFGYEGYRRRDLKYNTCIKHKGDVRRDRTNKLWLSKIISQLLIHRGTVAGGREGEEGCVYEEGESPQYARLKKPLHKVPPISVSTHIGRQI